MFPKTFCFDENWFHNKIFKPLANFQKKSQQYGFININYSKSRNQQNYKSEMNYYPTLDANSDITFPTTKY